MCGITGFVGAGTEQDLRRMTNTLIYRGPDAFFVDEKFGLGLGHRRLSIIDLERGVQPMKSSDQSCIVSFNGEIYNFQKLREQLLAKGHVFNTNSDTEVLLISYKEWGIDFVKKLNGMFAFALWDFDKRKLILVRDRLGQKPLYWTQQNKDFVFASELKAIAEHPSFKKELNVNAAHKYFFYEYIPSPETIYQDVQKLEPASVLVYQGGEVQIHKYWEVNFGSNFNSHYGVQGAEHGMHDSAEQALKNLDSLFSSAVKRRMISDVPLGLFLSGGLDSSAVAWYASQSTSERLKTFSVSFEDKSFDESEYARIVANHVGADHTELPMTIQEVQNTIQKLPDIFDEPIADAGVLPQYMLAQKTRKHVTVALSGDGGDELFMGYQTFFAEKVFQIWKKLPSWMKTSGKVFAELLPTSFNYLSFDYKVKQFVQAHDKLAFRHQGWLGAFHLQELDKLICLQAQEIAQEPLKYFSTKGAKDYLSEVAGFYQKMYLPQKVLAMVDRSSMQNSLEVRSPFLDHEVVNYVNQLPSEFKLKGRTSKFLLRELMKNKLPEKITKRGKQGFTVPMGKWCNTHWKSLLLDVLSEQEIKKAGLLQYDYVKQLLEQNFQHKKNNGRKLYTLLTWQLWYKKYFG